MTLLFTRNDEDNIDDNDAEMTLLSLLQRCQPAL